MRYELVVKLQTPSDADALRAFSLKVRDNLEADPEIVGQTLRVYESSPPINYMLINVLLEMEPPGISDAFLRGMMMIGAAMADADMFSLPRWQELRAIETELKEVSGG